MKVPPGPVTETCYARSEAEVLRLMAEGWTSSRGLEGTHHGCHAVLMTRLTTDEPEIERRAEG